MDLKRSSGLLGNEWLLFYDNWCYYGSCRNVVLLSVFYNYLKQLTNKVLSIYLPDGLKLMKIFLFSPIKTA
jgi:hypothetical protein